MKIEPTMINAAYDHAARVHAGKLDERTAVAALVRDHGMNEASAAIYVRNLGAILDGKTLKRTMSAQSFAIYLARIAEDYGPAAGKAAVAAVRSHIDYWNALGKGNLNSVSAVCDAAAAHLALSGSGTYPASTEGR